MYRLLDLGEAVLSSDEFYRPGDGWVVFNTLPTSTVVGYGDLPVRRKVENWGRYKILVAHESTPESFQHEMTVLLPSDDGADIVDDICRLLTESQVRDCIWKLDISDDQGD
jgi:hypothetical protein